MKYSPPIKLNFSEDLSYLIGVIQGDGSYKKSDSSMSIEIAVSKKEYGYAKFLEKIIFRIFGYRPCRYSYDYDSVLRISISKRNIVRSLRKFKMEIEIPKEVNEKRILKYYIRGLFDTDGYCYISNRFKSGALSFTNKKRSFVGDIKSVLECKYDIVSQIITVKKRGYKPVFRLQVTNKSNIIKFQNIIGFYHPRKSKCLDNLIKMYENVNDRFVVGSADDIILKTIPDKGMSTNEVASVLKRHRETIKEHLKRMEKKGMVRKDVVYFNRWGVINNSRFKRFIWKVNRPVTD